MARKPDILYVNFYTDGSAARKMAPAFPRSEAGKKPRQTRKKRRVLYVDPVAILSLGVAAAMLIMMAVGLTQLQNARAQAEAMEEYVQTLEEKNEALRQEYYDQIDLEEIEKTALALGMVPKTEVQTIQIQVDAPQAQEEEPTAWESILAFLTNLFA